MHSHSVSIICVKKSCPMEERNDIVIYKTEDGLVKIEAMVDPSNETIWASQKAIAALFGCTKQNVSYHMGKIFASGELERSAVVKEFLITAQSGARGLSEDKVRYYNLDAIISVGYRINSLRATKFRIWGLPPGRRRKVSGRGEPYSPTDI